MFKKGLICLVLLFYSEVCFCSVKSVTGLICAGVGILIVTNEITEIKTPLKEWDFMYRLEQRNNSNEAFLGGWTSNDPNPSTIAYKWSYSYVTNLGTYYGRADCYINHHIEYNTQKTINTQGAAGICLASIGIYMILDDWLDNQNKVFGFKLDNTPSKVGLLAYCKY